MTTLIFHDPREVAAYIDRFEDRSIAPLKAYLWEKVHEDGEGAEVITPVRREELDWMVLDGTDELRIDAAIYVTQAHRDTENGYAPLTVVITHHQPSDSDNPWEPKLLLGLSNKIEVNNFVKQITAEAAISFSVVESS